MTAWTNVLISVRPLSVVNGGPAERDGTVVSGTIAERDGITTTSKHTPAVGDERARDSAEDGTSAGVRVSKSPSIDCFETEGSGDGLGRKAYYELPMIREYDDEILDRS